MHLYPKRIDQARQGVDAAHIILIGGGAARQQLTGSLLENVSPAGSPFYGSRCLPERLLEDGWDAGTWLQMVQGGLLRDAWFD